ncbi:MAG: oligosaccharide flippase family protein [Nevskia sp.]|nr:oligosaccharide flippase family protein [Nevskia sp.]
MSSVKRNIVANYLGGAWSALMGLAFVPLYIRYLGIEAYGLIGVFTLLQSWLALLDLGLTPTISREMARFQAGAHTPQSIRDLMCSVERVYFGLAAVVALGLFFAAPWLATDWVRAEKLSTATVANALAVTGGAIAVRWVAGLYRSALTGLQRQVWLNGCTAFFSTLRGLGVVAVLAWVSSTIMAFFVFQSVLVALEALVLAMQLRRLLPEPPRRASFRWQALRQIWRFAAGIAVITLLSILLMQVDKLVLSKILPLTEFGYYTLAATVAGALSLAIGPINNAIYPQFTGMVARGETKVLTEVYHKFSQTLTLMLVPAALVLSLFSEHALLLWTRDAGTAAHVAPLVSVLAVGTMLNGLMHAPYTLQLAHGWTRFMVVVNAVSVVIVVPVIYIGVRSYGAIAAAYIWAAINAGYIVFAVPLMHRRLLPAEMWRWYGQDIVAPALAALVAAALVWVLAPAPAVDRPLGSVVSIALAAITAVSAAVLTTPLGRRRLGGYFRPVWKAISY